MWIRAILLVFAIGYLSVLLGVDEADALKCYHCRTNDDVPCPNDRRGELRTCVEKHEVACYKLVYIRRMGPNPKPNDSKLGESRRKGCGSLGAWMVNFNESFHPGCQPFNEYNDYCSCEEDRCNDEGKMTEYLTES